MQSTFLTCNCSQSWWVKRDWPDIKIDVERETLEGNQLEGSIITEQPKTTPIMFRQFCDISLSALTSHIYLSIHHPPSTDFFYWLDTPVDKQHSKVLLPLISCNFDNRGFPCPTQRWLFLTHKNFCLSMFAWTPMSVIDILWLGLDRALPLSLLLWSRLPSVYWCFCYNWFWRSIRTTAQVRGDMCSFENNFPSHL